MLLKINCVLCHYLWSVLLNKILKICTSLSCTLSKFEIQNILLMGKCEYILLYLCSFHCVHLLIFVKTCWTEIIKVVGIIIASSIQKYSCNSSLYLLPKRPVMSVLLKITVNKMKSLWGWWVIQGSHKAVFRTPFKVMSPPQYCTCWRQ